MATVPSSFRFDPATAFGILLAMGLMLAAIMYSGNIVAFLDVPSFLIVIGGTAFLTLACFTFSEVMHAVVVSLRTIFYNAEDASESASVALELAEIARKEGILSLDKYPDLMQHNSFLKRGIMLIVDGIPFEEVQNILGQQVASMMERHKKSVTVLRRAAEISPAMGLIGTLIGLIQMLGNLDDPSSIGPAMAIALLTTLYGAMLAYMVLSPLANKLERNSTEEGIIMDIYMLSVLSIGRKENPRRLEMLINSILPPSKRVQYFT